MLCQFLRWLTFLTYYCQYLIHCLVRTAFQNLEFYVKVMRVLFLLSSEVVLIMCSTVHVIFF
jgi:hypothetical protein